jgi:hypothetical protein
MLLDIFILILASSYMETVGYILVGFGVAVVAFVAIFLIVRWYVERKKHRAMAQKDLIERSFISQDGSVCYDVMTTHFLLR